MSMTESVDNKHTLLKQSIVGCSFYLSFFFLSRNFPNGYVPTASGAQEIMLNTQIKLCSS